MLYKYDEVDIRDGERDEDAHIALDATVFVSDGGYVKGTVDDYGTLIVRGGEVDIVIGDHGKVIVHGGTVHAVVKVDGSIHVHEGTVTIKEEGGYVQANSGRVTYEPSEIVGLTFSRYTTIHRNTKAVDCKITTTATVYIGHGGIFTATQKFALIQGNVTNQGTIENAIIDFSGKVSCTDNSVLRHCVISRGATVNLISCRKVQGIIIKDGTLAVDNSIKVFSVTLERKGKVIARQHCYITYRDHGGEILNHGGTLVRLK